MPLCRKGKPMDNYSEKYIFHCIDKRIQDIRQPNAYLKIGDRYYDRNWYIDYEVKISEKDIYINENDLDLIWLPNGDDLDNEIKTLCDEKDYSYSFHYKHWWSYMIKDAMSVEICTYHNTNPLIAKILTLKKLIELKNGV
jgi:hypothetical protein